MLKILLSHPMVYAYCLGLAVLLIVALWPRSSQALVGGGRLRPRAKKEDGCLPRFVGVAGPEQVRRRANDRVRGLGGRPDCRQFASCAPDYAALFAEAARKIRTRG
jgi:hypothetical protein